MQLHEKIFIAGHSGLVSDALVRCLKHKGYEHVVTRLGAQLDLTNQAAVQEFFSQQRPNYVFLAVGKAGGVLTHQSRGAELIYRNLMIQSNVIHAAREHGVDKLLFVASSRIYPKFSPQPLTEGYLMTGLLEPSYEADAVATIAGIKMCAAYNRQYGTNFVSALSATPYGPGDDYDPEKSHVLPALIRRFHEAKQHEAWEAVAWGSGDARREFIYCDDLAEACILLMERHDTDRIGDFINIGTGLEITVKELAQLIARIVGYRGRVVFDSSKPDGVSRQLLDVVRITRLGWQPNMGLDEGIRRSYADFLERSADDNGRLS